MEDLIAFMEAADRGDDDAHARQTTPEDRKEDEYDGMGQLLSLMHGADEKINTLSTSDPSPISIQMQSAGSSSHDMAINGAPTRANPTKNLESNKIKKIPASTASTNPLSNRKPMDAGVDERLGIRMINRIMPSVDLLDIITMNPFHSTADLSAMSLISLNKLLVEPTSIVDPATVQGKTTLVTVGIVFTNSGTRISAKGGAFCVMTIGNLQTGPCVTVMLFGDAYRSLCRSCASGTVVYLYSPKLMPQRDLSAANAKSKYKGGDTAISFSVHDVRQIKMVAKARDFGTCKAKVASKCSNGTWLSNNGSTCKCFVDTRVSEYCQKHRTHANRNTSSGRANLGRAASNAGLSFMQKMKQEFGTPDRAHNSPGPVAHREGPKMLVNKNMTATVGLRKPVLMHMKKTANLLPNNSVRSGSSAGNLARSSQINAKRQDDGKDWLDRGITRSKPLSACMGTSESKKNKRKINTDGGGFDGSVAVPKPSAMFSKARAPMQAPRTSSVGDSSNLIVRGPNVSNILERQKNQKAKLTVTPRPVHCGRFGISGKAVADQSPLSTLGEIDFESISKAKSRFASCVDAEEYAKSRRVVVELEKEEERKIQSKTNLTDNKSNRLVKVWFCASCNTEFALRPGRCVMANHIVKIRRSIRKASCKEIERTKLHSKSQQDGGLSLGTGLEWSYLSRFRN